MEEFQSTYKTLSIHQVYGLYATYRCSQEPHNLAEPSPADYSLMEEVELFATNIPYLSSLSIGRARD